jgi:hypothetical protein
MVGYLSFPNQAEVPPIESFIDCYPVKSSSDQIAAINSIIEEPKASTVQTLDNTKLIEASKLCHLIDLNRFNYKCKVKSFD